MRAHRESGKVEAGQKAVFQMDHGGHRERQTDVPVYKGNESRVFCDVSAYVSGRGYDGILQSV